MRSLRGPHTVMALVGVPEELGLAQTRAGPQNRDGASRVRGHLVEWQNVVVSRLQIQDAVARGLEVVQDGDFHAELLAEEVAVYRPRQVGHLAPVPRDGAGHRESRGPRRDERRLPLERGQRVGESRVPRGRVDDLQDVLSV